VIGPIHRVIGANHRVIGSIHRVHEDVYRVHDDVYRVHDDVYRVHDDVCRVRDDVFRVREGVFRVREGVYRVREDVYRVREDVYRVREDVCRVREDVYRVREDVHRVRDPVHRDRNVIFKNCRRTTYALFMRDVTAVWLLIGSAFVLFVLIPVVIGRTSSLKKRLLPLATSFGWEGPRSGWWNSIRGRWRGMDVSLEHMGRYKGVPERLQLTVKCASPARVIVKRRGGFMSKPLTLFGPPIVEPMNVTNREQFWIRSNELVLVERLFARAEVAPEFERNLIARFDVVDLKPKQLRILRAVDDSAVKKRFNRPFLKFGRDYELIETIASEEWKLAVMIVETLGLRGYEAA
jgi:hypothetical protein